VLADLNVGNARTYRCNPTEPLVSNDSWRRRASEEAAYEEQVMLIQRRQFDVDQDLAGSRHTRLRDINEFQDLERVTIGGDLQRAH
jgi:hypothetical protein